MNPIYRWCGEYFGFVKGDRLFTADAEYFGWITKDGRVWNADGTFLGEMVEGKYILRRKLMVEPVRKVRRVRPARPVRPIRKVNRVGRVPRVGWFDPLQ